MSGPETNPVEHASPAQDTVEPHDTVEPEGGAADPGDAGSHDTTVARFADLSRKLSQATVFFHSQIAEHVGLSATDHKCLDLAVQAERPLTAGQIAELSGLSTGAVTGVIDRLERAGFVRRVRDPHDRRKVLVEVSRGSLSRYGDVYEGLWSALDSTLADYTEGELKAIERYLTSSIHLLNTEAGKLSGERGPTG
jgi:DNA-binding MarR family transcriptional regulator